MIATLKALPATLSPYLIVSKIILWFFILPGLVIFILHAGLSIAHPYPLDYGEAPLINQACQGKEWAAGYPLGREDVWAARLEDLSAHPLGRQLAGIVGASMAGRSGYAVMARIAFPEVKLVGGIAGREGKEIAEMAGRAGETLRVGVSFGAITAWGREQDYKVNWPAALMFSDPTRSAAFILGP